MNNARRKQIKKLTEDLYESIQQLIGEYGENIQAVCDEEQECFDNLPESIQCSEKGDEMQSCIEAMETVTGGCEDPDLEYIFNDIQDTLDSCGVDL